MTIRRLPVELLLSILESLDSPHDLLSIVIASSAFYESFNASPISVLSSILRNAIRPDAMPHALATLTLMSLRSTNPSHTELDGFIHQYFGAECSFQFPTSMRGLTLLSHLCKAISYFVDDYSTSALHTLDDGLSITTSSSPSSSEIARFQRAFFQYEIYCLLFPPPGIQDPFDPHSTAQSQYLRFLRRLGAQEMEQMSYVHHYFQSFMESNLDSLEDEFVATAISLASVATEPKPEPEPIPCTTTGPYHTAISTTAFSIEHVPQLCDFRKLELGHLLRYSEHEKHYAKVTLEFFASFGSSSLYRLVLADANGRRNMIRCFDYPAREFLSEALRFMPRTDAAVTPSTESSTTTALTLTADDADFVRSGSFYYSRGHGGERGATLGEINRDLRERAFVFWDRKRVSWGQASKHLLSTSMTGTSCDQRHRQSAEKRLEGVTVTRMQMDRLINKYGTPPHLDALADSVDSWADLMV